MDAHALQPDQGDGAIALEKVGAAGQHMARKAARKAGRVRGVSRTLRRRPLLTLALLALPLAGAGVFLLSHGGPRAAAPLAAAPPAVVRSALVTPSLAGGRSFTGVIHARYESGLGFRVNGKILERLVDAGDAVRKGQPLMRLDPTDFALALKAAHAAVEAARATATQAASDEQRRRKLVAEGWVTPQAYEQNKAAADASAAQLRSALAQEKQAEDQASYAVLEADSDGVIMEVPGEPGQVVAAGQPVVRLAHQGAREAEVYLPEGTERMAGDAAVAHLYARPNDAIPARLRELSSMADPATRTYRARYILDGAGKDAPLGATVTLELSAGADAGRSHDVPIGALFDNGSGPAVWVIDAATSTVKARAVSVLRMGEELAAVSGDLRTGERIVALGAQLLRQDEKVEIGVAPLETVTR
ncbi:Efflux RND transporter periplasmic adaptor subunit [Beijerinckiaceae bacterium RH AL1]|nr:Efflux RND transporter periplasmic adaptor subunit [Beijerinckiaceae bacterium RH CH11]VVB48466.1 Efflux RND transporter periplasmic adaptor subunit [Beijerinckiaceae bacterium RH AL8]VVC56368.1 Efflux RND transporter periplasmic adaptor subunit [Beijerinckiaceae bacterium RH AL1]